VAASPNATASRPSRPLAALAGLIVLLFGLIAAGAAWGSAQWTPKLALDLIGGTQIILKPETTKGGGAPTAASIREAVNIIRQRVNGSGVTEAEVTTQGNENIVVSVPGKIDEKTRNLVTQSAQLQFRAVILAEGAAAPPASTTPPTTTGPAGTKGAKKDATKDAATAEPSAEATEAEASPTASENNAVIPPVARKAVGMRADKTPAATTDAAAGEDADGAKDRKAEPKPKPTDASDPNWVDETITEQFQKLDCTDQKNLQGGFTPDPTKPMVACDKEGNEKYVLGPAEVMGTDVDSAVAQLGTNSQGNTTGQWEVGLNFTSSGTRKFADVTTRLAAVTKGEPRNRFAILLDGLVISAPTTNERIAGGKASISGNFTQQTAGDLANQLKYGALPLSFRKDTEQQVSALLGKEQLQRGLLAGAIGLLLVILYSLLQYRALGIVTVFSLGIAGVIAYGLIVLLGWRQGYRLSLPGVVGLIVAIGITADSFIVFFERVRDEVRDGKQLATAVEHAWLRARRTILASDTVSFLAALVLYLLAVGGVRGFAFTLGLTTVIDVLVVFMFTKPMVVLLARTRFFGNGHKLSGFDAEHLGRQVGYAGRGRVRTPSSQTIAGRREAARKNGTPQDTVDDTPGTGTRQPTGTGRDA